MLNGGFSLSEKLNLLFNDDIGPCAYLYSLLSGDVGLSENERFNDDFSYGVNLRDLN